MKRFDIYVCVCVYIYISLKTQHTLGSLWIMAIIILTVVVLITWMSTTAALLKHRCALEPPGSSLKCRFCSLGLGWGLRSLFLTSSQAKWCRWPVSHSVNRYHIFCVFVIYVPNLRQSPFLSYIRAKISFYGDFCSPVELGTSQVPGKHVPGFGGWNEPCQASPPLTSWDAR